MYAVIVTMTLINALLAAVAAYVNGRAAKACTPVNRLFSWGCAVYSVTRFIMLIPPWAPENSAGSVLAAVVADTAILLLIITYAVRPCVARRGYRRNTALEPKRVEKP